MGTLNGTPEKRALVKQMFSSIVEVPQLTNTNQVREGQTRLLTPKELMIQLHDMETEVGLRKAKEGKNFFRVLIDGVLSIVCSHQHLL